MKMSEKNQKTLLLVDDEAIIAMAEKMALEKYGYKIVIVNSGEEAIATVKKKPAIDLVLMDINLGAGIDGTEAAAAILKERDLPVVFLSSHMEPEVVAKTERITSYGYVVKNSSITVLDASIKMAFKLFEAKIREKEKESRMEAALEALRKNEQRMRAIVEGTPHLFFYIQDAEANTTYVSPTIEQITGYKTETWIKRKDWFITDAALNQAARERTHANLRGEFNEEPVLLEVRHALGHSILLEAYEYPITKDGRVTGLQGVAHDITQHKLAESQKEVALAALQESEEWNQLILQTVLSGVMVIEVATRKIVEVNDTALKLIGLPKEQVVDSVCHRFVCPAEEKNCPILDLGKKVDFSEKILLAAGGKQKNIIKTVVPVQLHGREYLIESFVDITERKMAEAEKQESEERLRNIVLSMADWVWEVDEHGIYTYSSEKGSRLLGSAREDIIGKTPFDFMPPEEKKRVAPIFSEIMANKAPIKDLENWNIGRNGERICLLTNGVPILDEKGSLKGYRGVDQDITARKRAEEEIKNTLLFQQVLLDAVPSPIFYKDAECVYIGGNKAFEQYVGLSREQFVGKTVYDISPADLAEKYDQADRELFENPGIQTYEASVVYADGTHHEVVFNKATFTNAEGKVAGLIGVILDISERKRAEEEVKRQLAEKEILLKEVHHRIKNNFASVAGLLSLHLQKVVNPEAIAVLQDAIGRVDSMRVLYDKLLLSEGYLDISVKNYVESLAAAVVSLFPGHARVKLDLSVADFQLDPKRLFPLGIIINEVLTNIMKYAFSGREKGTIKISLAHADGHVTLTLQDNGNGLPDGFDINESKGFGLMLVKMLNQQLGGSFSIEKHKSTRCTVEFDV
jgi:PAS domain S-box-containing protein